ncbi:MAG: hypothetical protein ABI681_07825 [Gemmatimonadales bacterium]
MTRSISEVERVGREERPTESSSRVFKKAIVLVAGLKKLFDFRAHTWIGRTFVVENCATVLWRHR